MTDLPRPRISIVLEVAAGGGMAFRRPSLRAPVGKNTRIANIGLEPRRLPDAAKGWNPLKAILPAAPEADPAELILNRTWRPQLAVIGIDGLPAPQNAGNVLLPTTAAKLSLRLPPTLSGDAMALLKRILTEDPPHGAEVTFEASAFISQGWNAPVLAPWLEQLVSRAAEAAFGHAPAYMGEGGSIPFMGMLGKKFPKTQFVITGVLGPHSNAHGPNEFLHIPTGKRVTETIAHFLAGHLRHQ